MKKAPAKQLDINHGMAFYSQITIRDGDYDDCADANIIIVTAGIGRKPGQTRIDLAKTNISIIKDITKNIMKYAVNPLILVIQILLISLHMLSKKNQVFPPIV